MNKAVEASIEICCSAKNILSFSRELMGNIGKDGRLNLKGTSIRMLSSVFQNEMLFTAPVAKLGEKHKNRLTNKFIRYTTPPNHGLTYQSVLKAN